MNNLEGLTLSPKNIKSSISPTNKSFLQQSLQNTLNINGTPTLMASLNYQTANFGDQTRPEYKYNRNEEGK
jgi:hypothetical protein